jgi:16S rRNA (guanine1207-N2)-methyltransferase
MNDFYYSEKPISEISEKEFTETCRNKTLFFTSVSGVFSFDRKIDKASRLLIENFVPSGNHVLDMGCGYGAIGLFLKALYPQLVLTLADINERAVKYTKRNAEQNNLWVKVVKSDLYEKLEGSLFNDIVTNPPVAAGKKVVTKLITEARSHLYSGGALWLVAFHNKGGATYKKIIAETFGNVEDVVKKGGIRVYRAVN